MSERLPKGDVAYLVCDEGHVHLQFTDESGNILFEFAMTTKQWDDLAGDIDDEIDELFGEVEEDDVESGTVH